jgi:hypothetical protein
MMEKAPFLIVEQTYDVAIEQVMEQITKLGLQITQTFDLQQARQAHGNCPCPHHGTEKCDCQLVVILIYGNSPRPATMIAHGHEGRTWFSFVDSPQQHVSHSMETLLVRTLRPPVDAESLGGSVYAG